MTILETTNLSKKYGSFVAIDELNMTLKKGQILGLLGPNGSGKTTTLGMTLGTIIPTSGSLQWHIGGGKPNRIIGTLLETPNFYTYLNAIDNLKIVQKIKRSSQDDLEKILSIVNLLERKKSSYKTYSLGMKQRLAIASTLIGDPEVLILDEPTNGLDPSGIAEIRDIINHLSEEGKTILIASHILDEIEKVCSDVIILKKGKLLAQGSVEQILSGGNMYKIKSDNMTQLQQLMKEAPHIIECKMNEGFLVCTFDEGCSGSDINSYLFSCGMTINALIPIKKRLEEEFLKLID